MSDKVKVIRQEIERLINDKTDGKHVAKADIISPKRSAYLDVLNIIDSLPEESASEDLVEELDNFLKDPVFGKLINRNAGIALARHFAEWGRNHFEDKSEMVSEETTIVNDWQYGKDPDHAIIPAIHQRIEGFNVGDKLKIIIVKEEQQ